jgi:hypothetical protein
MMTLPYLPALALATLVLFGTGCEKKEIAPQPTEPVLVKVATPQIHTVAVRYHLEALSDTSQLPIISPNITVDYERVVPQGNSAYKLLAPSAQHHEQEVTSAFKEVHLAPIATYAEVIKPKITVTIWEELASPPGSGIGYQVQCELLIDGKSAGTTTYTAVAGHNTPLFITTQSEVSH